MTSQHRLNVIATLPPDRKEFMEKQIVAFDDMDGDFFMPNNGYCYHCGFDELKYQKEHGNNGEKGVTGCHGCHRSYCD